MFLYIQIKVYGKWISLPEVQNMKIEEEFCALKERSGTYILVWHN